MCGIVVHRWRNLPSRTDDVFQSGEQVLIEKSGILRVDDRFREAETVGCVIGWRKTEVNTAMVVILSNKLKGSIPKQWNILRIGAGRWAEDPDGTE
jgi:hypothetical protein